MKLTKNKKGFSSTGGLSISKILGVVIGIILFIGVIVALYPTLSVYAGNMSTAGQTNETAGIPLGGLLGITFVGLLLAAAVVITIYKALMPKTGR